MSEHDAGCECRHCFGRALDKAHAEGAAQEREACAKLADEIQDDWCGRGCVSISDAIRARGEIPPTGKR